MTLSIVIPAYNEAKRIGSTLERIGSYFMQQKQLNISDIEFVIVVNNTTDNTVEVIKKYQKKYPFFSIVNVPLYTGKGGAVAIGFNKAKGQYVGFLDADGSSSPEEIMKLYSVLINNKNLTGAVASRYTKGGEIIGKLPIARKIFSRFFNAIVRYGFGLNYADTQCGLKIFKRGAAKLYANRISTFGWTFDLNLMILAKYFGHKIEEVPTKWISKDGSTLNVKKAMISVSTEIVTLKLFEIKYFMEVGALIMNLGQVFSTGRSIVSERIYPWSGMRLRML